VYQLRARHRPGKFLLRAGRRQPEKTTASGVEHLEWVRAQRFEHPAQQATMVDYLGEVDHVMERIRRLEAAIDDAIKTADPTTRAVIDGLQALRGIAKLTATTLAVEIGNFSRFERARQLMSWSGTTPSEHSSGKRRKLGAMTKAGNSHVRRVLFEAAWSYRHRPGIGAAVSKVKPVFAAMAKIEERARTDKDVEAWAFANYGQKIKPLMEGITMHECVNDDAYKAALAQLQ
jgi:transposase